ncbi:MAG: hypothetical protein V3V99_05700 [candidate division Zixibacteria bacterium]
MPEEEKTKAETPKEGGEEQKPKKSKGPMMLIIISVVGFAICIGAFSFFMGVFSSPPAGEGDDTATVEEKHAEEKSAPDQKQSEDEDMSEIDALESELFGLQDIGDVEDMDDMMDLVDNTERGMSKEDSIEAANWLENEKEKLTTERKELDARKKELDRREYHLKQLLAKRDQMESARIGSLAKLYDGMKPQQVAPLINKLTIKQAVDVLLKMKPANAAKILGALKPDRAARISAEMITLSEE